MNIHRLRDSFSLDNIQVINVCFLSLPKIGSILAANQHGA